MEKNKEFSEMFNEAFSDHTDDGFAEPEEVIDVLNKFYDEEVDALLLLNK
jgi:hypothetical protein